MTTIINKLLVVYDILFDEIVDPRTKNWFLIGKPFQCIFILAVYLMFVLKWGPRFMKNRPSYNIDTIMIIYNAIQVICCAYIFIAGIIEAWGWKYKLFCEPVDYSNSKSALEVASITYYYFLLKILDLMDTVFFVLRKKYNQISFLHIYHHAGMVILIWGAVTYVPGGHGTLVGVINSFVHTVMYSYYLISVAMPKTKELLWIKKHVTQIQILQFFLCVVHMGSIAFMPNCEYPRWTAAVFLPQNLFILILFMDFYIKTYIKKPKTTIPVTKLEEESRESDVGCNNLKGKENHGSVQRIIKSEKIESKLI
ncbi:elongation of very long chain fatty acids protein 1-like [Vanessa atalanta]|uniref:elongation of very long chain fatty acids protein 1-like n=1 Tax=Vanessa atalanta TaxID=42275 RepID=UPI001FCE1CD9|nr:elongation of very long chain fatty acids protein 1-like [Vanessa atalanta]